MQTGDNSALPTQLSSQGHIYRPVVVLGAWSSGTTACVSMLERLGYWSCPPHALTNDPRTPSAHEPRLLRNMILWYFDEVKLEKVHDKPDEVIYHLRTLYASYSLAAGSHWRRGVVMKLPHLCFYVPELYHALDPQFIVMTRDIDEIENTRERRGWHLALGRMGAEQCLEHMTRDFHALNLPYLEVPFEDLRADPQAQLGRMANFLGTTFTPSDVDNALEVLVRR